jgi:hypothetical protein
MAREDDIKKEKEELELSRINRKKRIAKLRMAAIGVNFGKPERREIIQKSKNTKEFNQAAAENALDKQTNKRVRAEVDFINTGEKIRPPKGNIDVKLRRKLAALDLDEIERDIKPMRGTKGNPVKRHKKSNVEKRRLQRIEDARTRAKEHGIEFNYEAKLAKEHKHSIVFRSHAKGQYKSASLSEQGAKYAKYWLLNAKQVNGNGWGIAQHTARENMNKFIGRPLVVTAASWHGASEYGNRFEHPYLPTNDMNRIFAHQEKFRVGSIVGIDESPSGDFHAVIEMLPKFAHMTLPPFCSPAIYQLDAMEHEGNISKWEALHLAALDENPAYGAKIAILKGTCVGTEHQCTVQFKSAKLRKASVFFEAEENEDFGSAASLSKRKPNPMGNAMRKRQNKEAQIVCPKKVAKVKTKLATITAFGEPKPFKEEEQKKLDSISKGFNQRGVKSKTDAAKNIVADELKKKTARIAKSNVTDILRGKGRSVDGSHSQSTFLSAEGDFIGGTESHVNQILEADPDTLRVNPKGIDSDKIVNDFVKKTGLVRVQTFPINRAGVEKTSVGISSPINQKQLKSIRELEKGGREIGFAVGEMGKEVTGTGTRELVNVLRKQKLLM